MPNKEKINAKTRRYPVAVYTIILLLGIIIIIIPLLNKQETIWAIMVNVGTDILGGAVIFFVLRLFLLDERDNIVESLDDFKSDVTNSLTGEVNKYLSMHTPNKIYHSSQTFKSEFNLDLTTDLCKSSFYIFRGVSAKYVPVRIRGTHNTLSMVRVIMLDPTNDTVINLRAKDRTHNPKNASKSIPQLASELREEIYMTTVSLFDCRHICPIEIIYDNSGTSVIRLEIFEQNTYLSFYQSDESFQNTFPETIRYPKDSLFHQLYRIDSFRASDILPNRFTINNLTQEKALREHLEHMGCQIGPATLENYRACFETFYNQANKEINIYPGLVP